VHLDPLGEARPISSRSARQSVRQAALVEPPVGGAGVELRRSAELAGFAWVRRAAMLPI